MYPIEEYTKTVKYVIPLEKIPKEETLEEELYNETNNSKEVEEILKGLKIKRIANKRIKELDNKEFVLYQIATALISKPKILLLDSIDTVLGEEESIEVLSFLKEQDLTVVYTTINLDTTLICDSLYIIGDRKVALKGTPLEVLKYDNIINKIGLNIPFMVDLSVKLKDYDLVKNIELNQERMLDLLWK
jgi:ABC-type cobalamin/Fe3+-siderophores transport system ATPase subunit